MKISIAFALVSVTACTLTPTDGDGAEGEGESGEGEGESGEGEGESGCRAEADCDDTEDCVPPDADAFPTGLCGACFEEPDECAFDADCGPGLACRNEGPCACGVFQRICVTGCANASECLDGQLCDAEAHCVFPTCVADTDCVGSNFACTTGVCARRTCAADEDCGGASACVSGRCYSGAGSCVEIQVVP